MKTLPFKFIVFLLLLFFIYSCSSPSEIENNKEVTAYITGVEITALDKLQNENRISYFHSDTLRGQLVFEVKTQYELHGGTFEDFYNSLSDNPLSDQLMPRVENPISWSGGLFKINKDIETDGVLIKANKNLVGYDNVFFPYSISPFAIHSLRLEKEHFQIKKGTYKIYAAWKNVEGKIF